MPELAAQQQRLIVIQPVRFAEQRRHPLSRKREADLEAQLLSFAENVVETIGEMQNVAIEQRTVDSLRSISISNCCVSTVDFDIQPEESDPKYAEMVETGEQTTREYLENYQLPTDWLAEFKEKMDDFLGIWR